MNKSISNLSDTQVETADVTQPRHSSGLHSVPQDFTQNEEFNVAVGLFFCPRCNNEKLHQIITKTSRYRQCENCGGIWFNINELEKAVGEKI
ncbi:MAG: zf-TFIIB domain-containing protein, partial [Planctomycetota bacterium]|nr:zf-TFIIB domain-containing protein [Planctomycetota bacterium]